MKILLNFFTVLCFTCTMGQGLNGEVGINDRFHQFTTDVVTVDEYSYLLKQQYPSGGLFVRSELVKIDTMQNVIWSVPIEPISGEVIEIGKMIPSNTGGVYISGTARYGCDLAGGCFTYIQEYDNAGNVLWTQLFEDLDCFDAQHYEFSRQGSELYFNHTVVDSKIYTMDLNGDLVDSLEVNHSGLSEIGVLTGFENIACKEDSLLAFDNSGQTVFSHVYSSEISNMIVNNDTLYVLTTDSIFQMNNNLQQINGRDINGYNGFSDLKVDNSKVRFVSQDLSDQHIIELDHDLGINSVFTIPAAISVDTPKDFNDLHFSCASNFDLTEFQSIRHLDYSMTSAVNETINSTDIGIVDIEFTQIHVEETQTQGVYDYDIYANVLLKNYGNNVLQDCKLNHYIQMSYICGYIYYFEEFTDLNLAPDDSVWLTLGLIHPSLNYFSGDTLTKEICVYTSHPNGKTDLAVANDNHCQMALLGYASVEKQEGITLEIYPNPARDYIHIQVQSSDRYIYEIVDKSGNLMREGELSSEPINIEELASGVYFLRIKNISTQRQEVKKIVKI